MAWRSGSEAARHVHIRDERKSLSLTRIIPPRFLGNSRKILGVNINRMNSKEQALAPF
jgi:hypothetical protein